MAYRPKAQLTKTFLDRVKATGMTDTAIALAIGVSKQFYSEVKNGRQQPSTAFIVGAIRAGLGETFSDIAEPSQAEDQLTA